MPKAEGKSVALRDSERGVFLVLFALLLIPLLMMISLAIDTTMLAESHERGAYFSRIATLRALESYFSNSSLPETQRRQDALTAAQTILAQNHLITGGSPGTIVSSGQGGALLEPGIWHYVAPTTGTCAGSINCFESTPNPSAPERPNAYRLSGALNANAPTVLAQQFFPGGTPPVSVDVIASVIPRRGCFLVDMSPSTNADTHVNRTIAQQTSSPQNGHGSQFAFFTGADNPWSGASTHDAFWNFLVSRPTRASGGISGQNSNPLVHYSDDYVLKGILNDTDYDRTPAQLARFLQYHPDPRAVGNTRYVMGSANRYFYRVDQYRSASHVGPQPLRSIFTGLRAAIQEFKSRRVSGDMACLIFYDNSLSWSRIVKPTADFDYLLSLTDYALAGPLTGDNPAQVTTNGLDVTATSEFELAIRHGLFPFINSFTDLRLALEESLRLLAAARAANPGVPTSDFVVLIGDGLTNCVAGYNPYCNDMYVYYRDSQAYIRQNIIPQLIQQNIAAHVILIGDQVGPHTIDIRRSPTDATCMDDSEARTKNVTFVGGGDANMNPYPYVTGNWSWQGAYNTKSAATPFYQVNFDMYNIARRTRGLWIPVRSVAPGCVPPSSPRQCGNQAVRLRTDPQCRTDQQQVIDGMRGILGQNPYVIVSVK